MPNRKSPRLNNYNYAQEGFYFFTFVTHQRKCLLSKIVNDKNCLTQYGEILNSVWLDLPNFNEGIMLDSYCIMPNHFHGIAQLNFPSYPVNKSTVPLTEIIRQLKSYSAKKINLERGTPGAPVWQRSFFDRIIRNERELYEVRLYIEQNPLKWSIDQENPDRV
ncbi:MAG: hypothetical protein SCALA702_22320 [Melioribacteraceae bacterium]|nr:MAG: hypothetical protein SCALA702_22320 [Melioribacteraceae bacterium]